MSLHVHWTIGPCTIIEAIRERNGDGFAPQPSLSERPEEKLPFGAVDLEYPPRMAWSCFSQAPLGLAGKNLVTRM